MAKLNDILEQAAVVTPDQAAGIATNKELETAKETGNATLERLLVQKQNMTQQINKLQQDVQNLDVQIAQQKVKPAAQKLPRPAGAA